MIVLQAFVVSLIAMSFPLQTMPGQPAQSLPLVPVSSSQSFDRLCPNYYRQGNDPDVQAEIAAEFCTCIAGGVDAQGLGTEVLDFLGRTYSEDLTAFIGEYPKGEAWMEAYFKAEKQCKTETDFGSNEPQAPAGDFPMEAASWGGIVRDGPGQEYKRLTSLTEGQHITLLENTGIVFNQYPWFKIRYSGSREGYQWGGIICGLDAPIDGAFETCD